VPAALDRICLRALSRRPEERFPSCEELSLELERVVHDLRWSTQRLATTLRDLLPPRRDHTVSPASPEEMVWVIETQSAAKIPLEVAPLEDAPPAKQPTPAPPVAPTPTLEPARTRRWWIPLAAASALAAGGLWWWRASRVEPTPPAQAPAAVAPGPAKPPAKPAPAPSTVIPLAEPEPAAAPPPAAKKSARPPRARPAPSVPNIEGGDTVDPFAN